MVVAAESIGPVLETVTQSLTTAVDSLSTETALELPADGISLLNVKNELLLDYLQNLVFLVLHKLQQLKPHSGESHQDKTFESAVKKLIHARVFLERGTRPLEGRLKYQIDNLLRAAATDDKKPSIKSRLNGKKVTQAQSGPGSDENDSSTATDAEDVSSDVDNDELSSRPNIPARLQKAQSEARPSASSKALLQINGTYKPPKITPTVMPETLREKRPERRQKSNLLEEYVNTELSSAPAAQPSIGSSGTILNHGRSSMSARGREKERERTEYEEKNFTRLAKESKADRRKALARGEGGRKNMYGGEDFVGLGDLGDGVSRSVGRKGASSVLERRDKRRREHDDMSGGVRMGEGFEKKRRILEGRARKKHR